MAITTNISLYLMAGEVYTIHVPVSIANNMGYFPRKGVLSPKATGKEEQVTLQNGFYVENDEVGQIITTHSDKVAIDYFHQYSVDNVIWFLALTGEKARVSIATMPVHDHASVSTGGPAYGTYYSGVTPKDEGGTS